MATPLREGLGRLDHEARAPQRRDLGCRRAPGPSHGGPAKSAVRADEREPGYRVVQHGDPALCSRAELDAAGACGPLAPWRLVRRRVDPGTPSARGRLGRLDRRDGTRGAGWAHPHSTGRDDGECYGVLAVRLPPAGHPGRGVPSQERWIPRAVPFRREGTARDRGDEAAWTTSWLALAAHPSLLGRAGRFWRSALGGRTQAHETVCDRGTREHSALALRKAERDGSWESCGGPDDTAASGLLLVRHPSGSRSPQAQDRRTGRLARCGNRRGGLDAGVGSGSGSGTVCSAPDSREAVSGRRGSPG